MTEIETTIQTVTVFRDGARVTRVGEEQLVPGEQVLVVKGVSAYAKDDSFRVKGTGAAVLRSIDVKSVTETFEPENKLKDLRLELENLQKKRKELEDEKEFLEKRYAQLGNISRQFASEYGKWFAAGESKIENLSSFDKTALKLLRDIKSKLRKILRSLEDLDTQIAVVRKNMNKMQGERRTETTKEVYVSLAVKDNTKIKLELTYQLYNAGWTPQYDVDLGEKSTRVKRMALVYNNTLEDWKDVRLTVSTASAQPVMRVEPSPFYVDESKPVTTASTVMRDMDAEKEEAFDDLVSEEGYGAGLGAADMKPMAERMAVSSEILGGTVIYNVPGTVDILAEEEPHPVTLIEEEFESRRLHYWNAYAMSKVVAQDEVTNGDSVILPGEVKVYASGDFLSTTNVMLIAPREKFRIGTRVAYDIKAEKKLVTKDIEKAGFTRGKKRQEYKYLLQLESFSKEPVEIRVLDRIPHSSSEKIEVTLRDPSIPVKKSELGVLEWELALKPKKKLELKYAYSVEWEKDIRIRPPLP